MASEDQDILAKISQLAGQINRHKNGQPLEQQTHYALPPRGNSRGSMGLSVELNKHATDRIQDYSQGWRPSRGVYNSRGYGRGGRTAPVHRNRSLVLNGTSPAPGTQQATDATFNSDTEATGIAISAPAFISKTDRHRQLINSSIYEKDSQNRAKAMEETRKHKLRQRDQLEKAKFKRHLQHIGGYDAMTDSSPSVQTQVNYEINVQGIRFRVAKNGSKLIKVPGESSCMADNHVYMDTQEGNSRFSGDLNAAKSTPKTALVGGVRFYRSKNGNMYRSGIIKAHRYGRPSVNPGTDATTFLWNTDTFETRRTGVIKKIDEPCKAFSTTGSSFQFDAPFNTFLGRGGDAGFQLTLRFLGSCSKGPRCRYIHDPSKVAVCKEFLLKGSCPSGDSCDLSHELTPQRTPNCLHFAKGNCSNPNCRYTHVRVSPSALVCRLFGVYGYCEKGSSCAERHVHECPDFSNTGTCTTKGCKLPHRHKASVMRTNTALSSTEEESSDISSDEEDEEIDSDDVDSDDLDEEYFGDDGTADRDIPMQQDFVGLL